MNHHTHQIYHLEELAANAWPAAITQTVDGWRLRYTKGITRRANSVWPNQTASSATDLAPQLATVEHFYAQRDLPARFQICPAARPHNLEQTLEEAGYTADAPTNVQTTTIKNILSNTNLEKREPDLGSSATIDHHPTAAWANAYDKAEGHSGLASQVRQDIMQRIAPRTGFASIRLPEQPTPVAIGLGVVERGWLGIFCMATDPNFRRRGFASALLHSLAEWANQQGATNAYLQVMVENENAQKLYSHYGFNTLYQYHYREKGAK